MAKKKEVAAAAAAAAAADPETEEKKRLRSLAFSRKLLGRAPANPAAPLPPTKSVLKIQGRDIAKRGQRKSRYLFSFPGLLAPLSSGRVGELADLGTRNPILYLEFPQGRMKLFGTHVYPKNKYLTLQLTKSSKGVMVEDIFESMIVFSDAWWIGQKEENPHEEKLEFPKFDEAKDSVDCDFKGGAGATMEDQLGGNISVTNKEGCFTPETETVDDMVEDFSSKQEHIKMDGNIMTATETTPVRQSTRISGKKLSYAESSSGNDYTSSDAEIVELTDEKNAVSTAASSNADPESELVQNINLNEKMKQPLMSLEAANEDASGKKGPLVQATLSTLFNKVANKTPKRKATSSPRPKGSVSNKKSTSKRLANQVQVKDSNNDLKSAGKKRGAQKAASKKAKVPDDVEVISSASQDDSDEDWVE